MAVHRETLEEMLELLWTAAEDRLTPIDRRQLPTQLRCFLPQPIEPDGDAQQEVIATMIHDGLITAQGERIALSVVGERQAKEIVRRHRLTEVLLHTLLAVSDASVESTACQVEHILNPEVTEAVCAFLGHPPACPHGRVIPRAACCQRASRTVAPLIVPLAHLALGESASIAFIHSPRHAYLQRLSALGLAPGRLLRLRQTQPAIVIQIGETELALDRQAGEEIYVKRQGRAEPAP